MYKLINFRPFFIISLSLGLGIFFTSLIIKFNISFFYLLLLFPILPLLYIPLRKYPLTTYLKYLLCILLSILYAVLSYSICYKKVSRVEIEDGEYLISGRIVDKSFNEDDKSFVLNDVSLSSVSQNKHLDYKLRVFYEGENDYNLGDIIFFYGSVDNYTNMQSVMLDKIKYYSNTKEITVYKNKFSLFLYIKENIFSTLSGNMDGEDAGISFALITGDCTQIEKGTLANFRYGGIAHIFAVSGLHIGILAGVCAFILNKLKTSPKLNLILTSIIIIIYSGICGFSSSSVRAVIMCIVLLFTKTIGVKYDRLESLSFACLLLMLINPAYIFSVGFLLSISATVGTVLVFPCFKRVLLKVKKIPQKISESIALIIAVQISTIPIMIDYFGYISLLGIFTNFLFIPIISILYITLLFTVILAMILPFISLYILYLPAYFVKIVKVVINLVDYSKFILSGFSFKIFAFPYYVGVYNLTDKVNLSLQTKSTISFVLFLITILGVCLTLI